MSKFSKVSIFAIVIAIAVGFAFSFSPAQAAGHETFDLYVKHNINGRSIGAAKELPVDVIVNLDGEFLAQFTFSFGESRSFELPAGEYSIKVNLAGTDTTVMSFGPGEIPAGADVSIRATLGAGKTPTLRVNVK